MKKVRDMTEEEIDLEFEKQYKRDYLLEREQQSTRNKIRKGITIFYLGIMLFILALLLYARIM